MAVQVKRIKQITTGEGGGMNQAIWLCRLRPSEHLCIEKVLRDDVVAQCEISILKKLRGHVNINQIFSSERYFKNGIIPRPLRSVYLEYAEYGSFDKMRAR